MLSQAHAANELRTSHSTPWLSAESETVSSGSASGGSSSRDSSRSSTAGHNSSEVLQPARRWLMQRTISKPMG